MPKKSPLTKEVKARISPQLEAKLTNYCRKYNMTESAVLREALKKILHNTAPVC